MAKQGVKRVRPVAPKDSAAAVASVLSKSIKTLDEKLAERLEELNRSQLRAGEISKQQNDILKAATKELEKELLAKIGANGMESAEIRKELSNLRADVSQTTARLLDYIAAKTEVEEDDETAGHINSLYAIIENMREEMERMEEFIAERTQRFLTGPISGFGGRGGGAIEVLDEGIVVSEGATCLNFVGTDVLVQPNPTNPDCLDIYIPPPSAAVDLTCPMPVEVGTFVTDAFLTWVWSVAEVTSQTLSGPGTIPPITNASRSATVTDVNTDFLNRTWNISGIDVLTGVGASDSCSLLFAALQYWGRAPVIPTTSAEVVALANNRLVTGKDSTIDFAAQATPEFTLFCYPDAYGDLGNVVDPQTNFNIPTIREADVIVTNGLGYRLLYRVYRANQQQAGPISWSFASNGPIQLPATLP